MTQQPGMDGAISDALAQPSVLHARDGLRGSAHADQVGGRQADDFYRDRWSHDKVVRSRPHDREVGTGPRCRLLPDPRDVDGSHASGARFMNLIGGSMLSFYDWYADVPESSDWWDAGYLTRPYIVCRSRDDQLGSHRPRRGWAERIPR